MQDKSSLFATGIKVGGKVCGAPPKLEANARSNIGRGVQFNQSPGAGDLAIEFSKLELFSQPCINPVHCQLRRMYLACSGI